MLELDKAIKAHTEECGFQKSSGYIYKIENNYIYWVRCVIDIDNNLNGEILIKPIELNYVFWDIFGLHELKKKPKSFHVKARFSAKFVSLTELSFDLSNGVTKTYMKLLHATSQFITKSMLKLNSLHDFSELIKFDDEHKLNYLLTLIYFNEYKTAYEIVSQAIGKREHGGFITADGQTVFEKIKLYCQCRLQA